MEGMKIDKTGKLEFSPLLFNGIALLLLLVVTPFSIAYATNANALDSVQYYNTMKDADTGLTTFFSSYMELPSDYQTELKQLNPNYQAGDFLCSHIEPYRTNIFPNPAPTSYLYYRGVCLGDNSQGGQGGIVNNLPIMDNQARVVVDSSSGLGSQPYIFSPQIHRAGNNPSSNFNPLNFNHPIAFDENLTISYRSAIGFNLSQESTGAFNSIRLRFIEHDNSYACDDPRFDPLYYKWNFELILGNTVYVSDTYQGRTDNSISNSQGTCNPYFEVVANLDYFESQDIDQLFNSFANGNPNLIIAIQKVEPLSGDSNQEFFLPMIGKDSYYTVIEASTIDDLRVSGQIDITLIILSVILGYIAIASTPYYDPLRNFFKGALE